MYAMPARKRTVDGPKPLSWPVVVQRRLTRKASPTAGHPPRADGAFVPAGPCMCPRRGARGTALDAASLSPHSLEGPVRMLVGAGGAKACLAAVRRRGAPVAGNDMTLKPPQPCASKDLTAACPPAVSCGHSPRPGIPRKMNKVFLVASEAKLPMTTNWSSSVPRVSHPRFAVQCWAAEANLSCEREARGWAPPLHRWRGRGAGKEQGLPRRGPRA